MLRRFMLFAFCAAVSGQSARAGDAEMQAYIASLFTQPNKAVDEFMEFSRAAPFLTAYSLSMFTEKRCGTGEPSADLLAAGGGMEALGTETGKKILISAGVVGTMKFEDKPAEERFCLRARSVIDAALAALPPK